MTLRYGKACSERMKTAPHGDTHFRSFSHAALLAMLVGSSYVGSRKRH